MISHLEINTLLELLHNFYYDVHDIHDYYRKIKIGKLQRTFDSHVVGDMFNNWAMKPNDMDIEVVEVDHKQLTDAVELTSSFPQEYQVGCKLSLLVREKKTDKTLGYMRLTSPVLSLSCRNKIFGQTLNGKQVNRYVVNGAIFVPVQPFGYNCAGGKLLGLIGCSREVLEMYNKKFGTHVVFMETMALYGSLRPTSQYDGLEPIIKSGGLTESKLPLYPDTDTYNNMVEILLPCYPEVQRAKGLSGKSIQFKKMLQIIHKLHPIDDLIVKIYGMNTQKRYYYSTCGYHNPMNSVLTGTNLNWSKDAQDYRLCNLIDRWKRIAQRRHDNLESMNKLKTELESLAPLQLQRGF